MSSSSATIRDVAREAGVSVASVSRALNGHGNVRAELRARVTAAAERLGYVPHAGARNLSLARSGAIGVVLPDLHGEFYSELLRGMDYEASERGLHLLLMVMHGEAARGVAALNTMRGRVDGLMVMAPQVAADDLLAHLPASMPAVLLNCAGDGGGRPGLRIDNRAGAAAVIDHLVAGGRRRIAHVRGPVGNVDAEERLAGAEAACARAGVALRVLAGDFSQSSGVLAARTLLTEDDDVDAVFAANDMMAIGALTALRDAGIDVPDRIAVAGFDDIPVARLISPALTSASIDIADFGSAAVARLAAVIAGEDAGGVELRAPILVTRASTRAAPSLLNDANDPNDRAKREEP